MELGGKVDENKASSNGAVSYYTIYFVIDETLTIIPGEYFKIGDTFYEFDNYDELWDKFIVFNKVSYENFQVYKTKRLYIFYGSNLLLLMENSVATAG